MDQLDVIRIREDFPVLGREVNGYPLVYLDAGKLEAEPLLKALGTEEAVRAPFMFYNTYEEADVLAAALENIVRSAD
jgi:selenocysteine lyase/cysteine desulfurase